MSVFVPGLPNIQADDTESEIDRIVALSRRPVLNCEREKGTRRWAPEAQALVEVVTARYSKGQRISCGCQNRTVTAGSNGQLFVFHEGRPDAPPPLPVSTTVGDFCYDNAHNEETVRLISGIRHGEKIALPGLGHPFCLTELNPVQSWILWELPRTQGIQGLISVGGGKTIASILAPLSVPDKRTVIILAKPDQRLHYRTAYLRLREHFRVPSFVLDTSDMVGSYIVRGTPVLHFVPYSRLSRPDATDLLDRLNPDMIIADESHLLAARNSSRTMRFLRYMAKRNNVVFCNWSGSIVKKSLKDCCHLAAHALGLGSPYPIKPDDVDAWSAVIDPSPIPDTKSNTALALRSAFGSGIAAAAGPAVFESGFEISSAVREGHRDHVIQTPGIISTRSSSIAASITIKERKIMKIPDTVQKALAGARGGERPDGELLVDALEVAECSREVSAGYHAFWDFPRGEPDDLIEEWYARRKSFSKALRSKLMFGEVNLDSRKLCENAAERAWRIPEYEGELPVWPDETWPPWADIRDQVQPDPRTRWIDTFLAEDAAAWATQNKGIVWCHSRAFGKKVAELAGLPYHSGGPDAEAKILAEDGSRSVIASIKAHGTGRDGLQLKFCKQLLAEMIASGDGFEQFLGRLAREGQQADTVETEVYQHTSEYRDALRKAIMYAQFIEATTPNRQLLLAADITFPI